MELGASNYWRTTRLRNELGGWDGSRDSCTPRGSWKFRGAKEPKVTEELLEGMVKDIKDEQMKAKTLEGYRKQLGGFMKKNGGAVEDFGGGK